MLNQKDQREGAQLTITVPKISAALYETFSVMNSSRLLPYHSRSVPDVDAVPNPVSLTTLDQDPEYKTDNTCDDSPNSKKSASVVQYRGTHKVGGSEFTTYRNPTRKTATRACFFCRLAFNLEMMKKGMRNMAMSKTTLQTPMVSFAGAVSSQRWTKSLSQARPGLGMQKTNITMTYVA